MLVTCTVVDGRRLTVPAVRAMGVGVVQTAVVADSGEEGQCQWRRRPTGRR